MPLAICSAACDLKWFSPERGRAEKKVAKKTAGRFLRSRRNAIGGRTSRALFLFFGAPAIDRCLLARDEGERKKRKRNGNETSRAELCNMFRWECDWALQLTCWDAAIASLNNAEVVNVAVPRARRGKPATMSSSY